MGWDPGIQDPGSGIPNCDVSKTTSPISMKFGTVVQRLCQISPLTFKRSRSNFNVRTAPFLNSPNRNSAAVVKER